MIASRRAIMDTNEPITFTNVMDHLFSKRPPPYKFRKAVYEPEGTVVRKAKRGQLGDASLDQDEGPEMQDGWDDDWPVQEAHLWSNKPPGAGDDDAGEVEIMDIIMYDLPVFVFFMAMLLYIEVSACLWRRGRDFLVATAAWRGNDEAFKMQCAKESQIMMYRPYVCWFAVLGIWMTIKDAMDVGGKCWWNWECFFNLDCHVRIMMPAEAECVFDLMLPAAVVTGVLISGVLAAVWGFTRPWASLVLFGTFISGIFAIWTVSLFACTLWVFCAVGFNYFYFHMLPYIDESPAWCEDLGSLAFATNPRTGAVRDGDKAQHWKEGVDPEDHQKSY